MSELRDYLKERLEVPDNWDKFDYQTQRYSFEDIEEILESKLKETQDRAFEVGFDYGKKQTIQAVKDSLMSDEEIENCLTSSEFSQAVMEGIKTQRERTKKAIQ